MRAVLIAAVQLVPLLDAPEHAAERARAPSNQHLHAAVLFFLQQFRKVYVGDQATASSKVRARRSCAAEICLALPCLPPSINFTTFDGPALLASAHPPPLSSSPSTLSTPP